jgi:hypothetical protein
MSTSPASAAAARIAAKSRASSARVAIDGLSFASDASPAASMSVATTLALACERERARAPDARRRRRHECTLSLQPSAHRATPFFCRLTHSGPCGNVNASSEARLISPENPGFVGAR